MCLTSSSMTVCRGSGGTSSTTLRTPTPKHGKSVACRQNCFIWVSALLKHDLLAPTLDFDQFTVLISNDYYFKAPARPIID